MKLLKKKIDKLNKKDKIRMFKKIRDEILRDAYISIFDMALYIFVTKEKAKETDKWVKDYRKKAWKIAMKKCNNDREKAYKFYASNVINIKTGEVIRV